MFETWEINFKLKKNTSGSEIDTKARKYLKQIGLNYAHGTGHGVGYFLNVHEGPHAISKKNNVNFKGGMIVSNEPGYYEKNKFGIRIENLIYVKENNKKMNFENLTMAPIDKDLIKWILPIPLQINIAKEPTEVDQYALQHTVQKTIIDQQKELLELQLLDFLDRASRIFNLILNLRQENTISWSKIH